MLATTTSVSCEIKSNNLTDGGSYRSGSGGTNPIQLILNNENPFVAVIIQYRVRAEKTFPLELNEVLIGNSSVPLAFSLRMIYSVSDS